MRETLVLYYQYSNALEEWQGFIRDGVFGEKGLIPDTAIFLFGSCQYHHESGCANLQKCYYTILTHGEKELPAIPSRPSGKLAKSEAYNLWQRLKCHEQANNRGRTTFE